LAGMLGYPIMIGAIGLFWSDGWINARRPA
jgi:hypothetical protein